MFLQKQTFYQKLFTKQSAWFARACLADSIDIKFVKFGRVELKLWNLQNGHLIESFLAFKSNRGHVSVSDWTKMVRTDRSAWSVRSN